MEHDRHNFLSFWTVFCPFTHLWIRKIKIFQKNEKNTGIYYHFTKINDSHIIYGSTDMECWTEYSVILDHRLPFELPQNPKDQNLEKMKEKPWRYHHFT